MRKESFQSSYDSRILMFQLQETIQFSESVMKRDSVFSQAFIEFLFVVPVCCSFCNGIEND